MSIAKNLKQVYDANPITEIPESALLYVALDPFDDSSDAAIDSENFFSQIVDLLPTFPLPMPLGGTGAELTPTANSLVFSTATEMELLPSENNAVLTANATGNLDFIPLAEGEFIMGGLTGAAPFAAQFLADTNLVVNISGSGITYFQGGPQSVVGYKLITDADSPYEIEPNDYFIAVNTAGGPVEILAPEDMPNGKRCFIVKDLNGFAGTNNITVTTMSELIFFDGTRRYVINQNRGSAKFNSNDVSYLVT
jgi:hypothetical protein